VVAEGVSLTEAVGENGQTIRALRRVRGFGTSHIKSAVAVSWKNGKEPVGSVARVQDVLISPTIKDLLRRIPPVPAMRIVRWL
jgi:hypothetical protein